MKHLDITITTPNKQPVPIYPPDGKVIFSAHDFSCNDPRYSDDAEPYMPRVMGTKYTVPEAHKYSGGDPQKMTYEWALLWYELLKMYAPKSWSTKKADLSGSDNTDWSWLGSFVPKSELDKWWLHLIHYTRAYTNHMSIPMSEYYDPITGFSTGQNAEPFKKEAVTTGGNYVWQTSFGGTSFWALDGTKPAPKASQLKDMFFLVHISTQSTSRKVGNAQNGCPNGVFAIEGFPQAGDNIVPHPIISTWENGRQTTWNGLYLREAKLPTERCLFEDLKLPYPFIPERKMIVSF